MWCITQSVKVKWWSGLGDHKTLSRRVSVASR